MRLGDIKREAARMAGNSSTESSLYKHALTGFVNWTVQEVEAELLKRAKDSPIFRGTALLWASDSSLTDTSTEALGAAPAWLPVATPGYWVPGKVATNGRTSEQVRVAQVERIGSRVYLGDRGINGTTAAAILAGDEWTLSDTALGTGGDYSLPADYRSHIKVSGLVPATDTGMIFTGMTARSFEELENSGISVSDQRAFCTYGAKPSMRIRLYPHPFEDDTLVRVEYNRTQPRLVDDNQEFSLFPDNDGWEPILIYGAARHLYRMVQDSMESDPRAMYEELLQKKVEEINDGSPDDQQVIGYSAYDRVQMSRDAAEAR